MNRSKSLLVLLPLVLFLGSCSRSVDLTANPAGEGAKSGASAVAAQPFDYTDYAEVLQKYVDNSGRVDYKALQADRQKLDRFNASIGAVPTSVYEAWSEAEKIAFLVNAYNSLTLESIIDRYPTKSIRDIPGVWDRRKFKVVGQEITLNDIEHAILRKQFNEPRIHMGLVCASIGCPILTREPYTAKKLNEQLDRQSRLFLSNPQNFRIDRDANKVYLSSIFKWFGDDFIKTYGKDPGFEKLNPKETAMVNFIGQYLSPSDREYLTRGGYRVDYLNYDWSLNDKK